MAETKFRSARERDLVEELARLITQADPYGACAPADNRFREETASGGYDEGAGLPPAPQLPADLNAREQAYEFGEYRHDDGAYAVDDQPCAAQKGYQSEARTRGSVIAIVGLALLGAAGAFGYREMFGGSVLPMPPPTITTSTEPHKIPSASDAPQAKTRGKASQVGTDITGSTSRRTGITVMATCPTSTATPGLPVIPAMTRTRIRFRLTSRRAAGASLPE